MRLSIVSPCTHLNGHYWPYTCDLVNALAHAGLDFEVFTARQPRYQPVHGASQPAWHACCPWTRLLLPDAKRAKNWGSRADNLARNFEFFACLRRATKRHRGEGHIHCVESRHRLLLKEVMCSTRLTFSTLCVGDPPLGLTPDREDEYRRAFGTGRLTFIVETVDVRKAWEPLAGQHVVRIPAALPWQPHLPMPQKQARDVLGLPQDQTICLFFGTHRDGKDYETAIHAAKTSASNPFLLFAGPLISGNNPDALLRNIAYPNADSRGGYIPDEQVATFFDAADVVMLPYAFNYTKGSAVLLQACHFQKPVIATDTGHLRDFVQTNDNGLLYPSGSIAHLAKCYDQIAAQKTAGTLSNTWSFKTAHENYAWDKLLPGYLRIFNQSR